MCQTHKTSDQIVTQLVALTDQHPPVRAQAVQALLQMGPEAVSALLATLPDPNARSWESLSQDPLLAPLITGQGITEVLASWQASLSQPDTPLLSSLYEVFSVQRSRTEVLQALIAMGPPVVEPLIERLEDERWLVRHTAVKALAALNDARAVLPLTDTLRIDSDADVRAAAARALGHSRDPRATASLVSALRDNYEIVTLAAADALINIGPTVVEALIPALSQTYQRGRRNVAHVLSVFATPETLPLLTEVLAKLNETFRDSIFTALQTVTNPHAITLLIAGLLSPQEDPCKYGGREIYRGACERVCEAAKASLLAIGAPVVEALILMLRDQQPISEPVYDVLAAIGAPALEPLRQALHDHTPAVRQMAARALGRLRANSTFDGLLQALSDPVPEVRGAAAGALGHLRDLRACEALLQALSDPAPEVRAFAAQALGELQDGRAFEALMARLQDDSPPVRQFAAQALGELQDGRAFEALMARLQADTPAVREAAVSALGQLQDLRALEALTLAAQDPTPAVREAAVHALGQLQDPRAVAALIVCLGDHEEAVREGAQTSLSRMDSSDPLVSGLKKSGGRISKTLLIHWKKQARRQDARVLAPLVQALKMSWHQAYVVRALCEIRDPRTVPDLIVLLSDRHENTRAAAACVLGELQDLRALDRLIELSRQDKQEEVRQAAVEALIKFNHPRVVDTLLEVLREDYWVSEVALRALSVIQDARIAEKIMANLSAYTENRDTLIKLVPADQLMVGLSHPVADLRRDVFDALCELGDPRATGVLIEALSDPDWDDMALHGLIKIGQPAVEPLIARMQQDPDLSYPVIKILGKIRGPRAFACLKDVLKNNTEEWDSALYALTKFGRRALPLVIEALATRERYKVDEYLYNMCLKLGRSAVPALLKALDTYPAHDVRQRLLWILANIGDPRAIPAVERLLAHEVRFETRAHARKTLATLKQKDPTQIEARLRDLQASDPAVQTAARTALILTGMPAIKPLQNFLLTAAPEFRLIGVQILLAMLPDVQQPLAVLKLLVHALGDPDPAVIEALRQGLLDYCQQVREDPLQDEIVLLMTKALTHPQASARQTALAVLTHFRRSDSLYDIIDRLGDSDLAVQDAAASAVAKICDDFRGWRRVPDYTLWKMKKYLHSFNPYVSLIVAQVFDDCGYEYE